MLEEQAPARNFQFNLLVPIYSSNAEAARTAALRLRKSVPWQDSLVGSFVQLACESSQDLRVESERLRHPTVLISRGSLRSPYVDPNTIRASPVTDHLCRSVDQAAGPVDAYLGSARFGLRSKPPCSRGWGTGRTDASRGSPEFGGPAVWP
jgi:hypothetical protein